MDTLTPEQRSAVMARVRGKHTGPELIVRSLAHSLGYRFRLHGKHLPGCPDLVFASRRKVIFVNGCFWHFHKCKCFRMPKSRTEFWLAKLERNRLRDARSRAALKRAGWQAFTVWECQLRSVPTLKRRLVAFLER